MTRGEPRKNCACDSDSLFCCMLRHALVYRGLQRFRYDRCHHRVTRRPHIICSGESDLARRQIALGYNRRVTSVISEKLEDFLTIQTTDNGQLTIHLSLLKTAGGLSAWKKLFLLSQLSCSSKRHKAEIHTARSGRISNGDCSRAGDRSGGGSHPQWKDHLAGGLWLGRQGSRAPRNTRYAFSLASVTKPFNHDGSHGPCGSEGGVARRARYRVPWRSEDQGWRG